jgi:methylmalonyl-CoA/ethylmalonyl-CoA epimerase
MIGRLNHIAIVVPDLAAASELYRQALGARVSEPCPLPAHGVTVVFVDLPNTKIELLEPLGATSPVKGFLERNPSGGMHHICYEVDDIVAARDRLSAAGARVLGDGEPRLGAHDKPVLFLHPKDFCGLLSSSSKDEPRLSMGWVTGIVVYVLTWWVTLFAVLPLWVTPAEPDDPGHAVGAPRRPRLLLKIALTTLVSAVIWVGIYALVASPWFSFREP